MVTKLELQLLTVRTIEPALLVKSGYFHGTKLVRERCLRALTAGSLDQQVDYRKITVVMSPVRRTIAGINIQSSILSRRSRNYRCNEQRLRRNRSQQGKFISHEIFYRSGSEQRSAISWAFRVRADAIAVMKLAGAAV